VYDVGLDLQRMMRAYMVFYYGFLPTNMKPVYKEVFDEAMSNCGATVKERISEIHIANFRQRRKL